MLTNKDIDAAELKALADSLCRITRDDYAVIRLDGMDNVLWVRAINDLRSLGIPHKIEYSTQKNNQQ